MVYSVKDKAAIVTGGAQGLGYALASELLRRGCRVAVFDIKDGGPEGALRYEVDCTDSVAVRRAVRSAAETMEGLDIIVNNAGILIPKTVFDITPEQFSKQVDINLKAAGYLHIAAAHHLRMSKAPAALEVLSQLGYMMLSGNIGYSKIGHRGMSWGLEEDYKKAGLQLRVARLYPGVINTAMFKDPNHPVHTEVPDLPALDPNEVASVGIDALEGKHSSPDVAFYYTKNGKGWEKKVESLHRGHFSV